MSDQKLKDTKGITYATIKTKSDGKLVIYNSKGISQGHYDPKTNKTYNEKGISIGTGNTLATLVHP